MEEGKCLLDMIEDFFNKVPCKKNKKIKLLNIRMEEFIEKRPHFVLFLIASIMLLLALLPCPYGYYTFLRFIVCIVAAIGSLMMYVTKHKANMTMLIFIAILFNPIIQIHLDREIWGYIDVVVAIYLCCIAFITGKNLEKKVIQGT